MDAFRISPLGGRLSARNVVITTSDYTVSMVRVNLTWRYWLVRLTRLPDFVFGAESSPDEMLGPSRLQNKSNSASIHLLIDGLEVFVYNRKQAYDAIVETLRKADAASSSSASLATTSKFYLDTSFVSEEVPSAPNSLSFWLNVLPVQVRIKKGAVVLGNNSMPSVLCASYVLASALWDVARSPCLLDLGRFSVDSTFEKFQISIKRNITYDPDRYKHPDHPAPRPNPHLTKNRRLAKIRATARRLLHLRAKQKPSASEDQWRGLRRYIDGLDNEKVMEISHIDEYARYSMVLDSSSTRVVYYYDAPGVHPLVDLDNARSYPPPQFGVDIYLSLATIHYGPWAERQRASLHKMLFPAISRDSEAAPTFFKPGSLRGYAGFNLKLVTLDELILRVPTREFSKDRVELASQGGKQQKNARPFGWLELKLALNSQICSFMSYVASEHGFPNTLTVSMIKPEVRTSVNHDILFIADEHIVDCEVGFPLEWNGKCVWKFHQRSKNGMFFLLREHIFLMTDLMADFASGEPSPYEFFRPFEYQLDWKIEKYSLYFNVNDHNIINDPLDFDSNKYLCFSGEDLDLSCIIPTYGNFSKSSKIDYKITTTSLDLDLEVPSWHTVSAFMKGRKKMGSTGDFEVSGYYSFFNSVEVNQNNFVVINAIGDEVTLIFYGYLIKYLFTLRENYFGDFKHFRTFEEYSNNQHQENAADDLSKATSDSTTFENTPDYPNILKTENDLNVLFTFLVRSGLIVLPCGIYDCKRHIDLSFNSLDVDIHLTNFYMDLQADFSFAQGFRFEPSTGVTEPDIWNIPEYRKKISQKAPDITIDGFSVHTHRMFGLAPDLLTYYCKWDFASGAMTVDSDPSFLADLKVVLEDFVFGYKDLENALIYNIPIVYDFANFSFRCPEISLRISAGIDDMFLHVSMPDILVNFNDIANERYSSKLVVNLPSIVIKIIKEGEDFMNVAYLKTSLTLTNFCHKAKMLQHRIYQQRHGRRSDGPTHRIPFLLHEEYKDDVYMNAFGSLYSSTSLPTASKPLTRELTDIQTYSYKDTFIDENDSENNFPQNEQEQFDPTVDYYDEDFAPQTPIRHGYKNDAFVFELGAVEAFISPDGGKAITSLAILFETLDVNILMDRIQIEAINQLKRLILSLSMIDNLRFVCPSIEVRLVEHGILDPSSIICSSPNVPVVTVSIVEPSLAFSKVTTRKRDHSILVEEVSTCLAVHLKEIYTSVHDPDYFNSAVTICLKDLEAWRVTDGMSEDTNHIAAAELTASFESMRAQWTVSFIVLMGTAFKKAFRDWNIVTETSKVWRGELVSALTSTMRAENMQHDPTAITKPAVILRSCDDHVRFYESWKIVAKLRSILSILSILEVVADKFKNKDWSSQSHALEQVMDYFGTWRSWEGDNTQRSTYFNGIFGNEPSRNKNMLLFSKLAMARFIISDAKTSCDSLLLHGVTVAFSENDAEDEMIPMSEQSCGMKSVITNIEATDATISPTTFEFVSRVLNFEDCPTKEVQPDTFVVEANEKPLLLIYVLVNLKLFHLRVDLPLTFVEFYSYDNISSVALFPMAGTNVTYQSKEFNVSVGKGDMDYVDISFVGTRSVYVECSDLLPLRLMNMSLESLEIKFSDEDGLLDATMSDFIDKDWELIQDLFPEKLASATKEIGKKRKIRDTQEFLFTIQIENADCILDFLHPLRFHCSLSRSESLLSFQNGIFTAYYEHESISCDAKLLNVTIIHSEHSKMQVKSVAEKFKSIWLLKLNVDLGYLKINMPMIVKAMDTVLGSIPLLIESWGRLKDVASKFNFTNENFEVKQKPKQSINLGLDLRISQNYSGISIFSGNCRYTLEFEGLRGRISNVIDGNQMTKAIVPFWGELILRETRLLVLDSLIPVGLSTLMDLNLSLKVLNDTESTFEASSHSIQIESQHFRVCLSPPVLFKLSEVMDGISRVSKKHGGVMNKCKANDYNAKKGSDVHRTEQPKEKRFSFSSVHVLSYNFCVGWLFGSPHKDYPGFILGAERFFAVLKKDMGKLSLMEGYLSVANGSTCSRFYSTLSEFDNLNRAFMPKVQLNYVVLDDESLLLLLKGDVLDVRFLSNSIIMLERAIESVAEVQQYFEERFEKQKRKKSVAAELQVDIKPKDSLSPYFSAFKKVQINTTFAGATVLVHRLQEGGEESFDGSTPSLSLHSPAILVSVLYEYSKSNEKRHTVKAEILMSGSDNTLYPSCVPILMDITEASKQFFCPFQPKGDEVSANKQSEKLEAFETLPTDPNDSIAKMLNEIEFLIGYIVEKQRLSLSCEPTAKVAAIVVFDGASIQACTGIENVNSVYVVAQINPVTASLQHIYSDDNSGFVSIKNIIVSNVLTFNPSLEVTSSLCITDVSCHVKMKQYQDLDLFKDIWLPKNLTSVSVSPNDLETIEAKSSYSKLRKVSTSYAIPLWLTVIISDFMLDVDFGSALGTMTLDVDRAWVVSRKSSDWLYELKLGLQSLEVASEGRLGGTLKVKRFSVTSSVEWKIEEMPLLDIPLVQFAVGFDSFQLKTAFDNHYFAFAVLEGFRLDAFNRKNGINISKDHLFVLTKYDSMDVMLTSLAASEFLDIYNTIDRMIEENKTSYSEILQDSNKEHVMEKPSPDRLLEIAKKLETKIEISTGVTRVQIYPHAFDDTRVLSIVVDRSNASFLQNEYISGIANEIEIRLSNVNASLSTTSGISADLIRGMQVEELVNNAREARGGGILGFPRLMISMRTQQKHQSNVVEYLFQSSFGGAVDIRWNLGYVTLIREMYAVHKKALQSRTGFSETKTPEPKDITDVQNEEAEVRVEEDEEISQDLEKTLERVTSGSKYVYKALAPPIIETPQLRELGNATPPLEWFGLHRNKFPDATHLCAIVTMQKLIHEIEMHYSKALDLE